MSTCSFNSFIQQVSFEYLYLPFIILDTWYKSMKINDKKYKVFLEYQQLIHIKECNHSRTNSKPQISNNWKLMQTLIELKSVFLYNYLSHNYMVLELYIMCNMWTYYLYKMKKFWISNYIRPQGLQLIECGFILSSLQLSPFIGELFFKKCLSECSFEHFLFMET